MVVISLDLIAGFPPPFQNSSSAAACFISCFQPGDHRRDFLFRIVGYFPLGNERNVA